MCFSSLVLLFRILSHLFLSSFFFFNDTATTEIYTLSLHDALPIFSKRTMIRLTIAVRLLLFTISDFTTRGVAMRRSEEHTSELQSRQYLVCRLLLEKKKKKKKTKQEITNKIYNLLITITDTITTND